MDKVLYLEPDEEVTGIIDRIAATQEDSIALVVPAGAILLSSSINIRLLKAESEKLNKDIAIVTSDPAGRTIASQIGFTVYETLGEARDTEEREKQSFDTDSSVKDVDARKGSIFDEENHGAAHTIKSVDSASPSFFGRKEVSAKEREEIKDAYYRPEHSASRKMWFIGAGVFVVLLFLIAIIFPKATVYLTIHAQEETVDMTFKVDSSVKKVSSDKGLILPGVWQHSEKEVEVEVTATGEKNIGEKAEGTVVIYNRSGRLYALPAGSIFTASDNKVFTLVEGNSIPGAIVSDFGELIPGKVSVIVRAQENGSNYNIQPTRFTIGELQEIGGLVYGISEESFSGGTDRTATVVSKEDIDVGREKAKNKLEEELGNEFGDRGEKVFVSGLAISEVVKEEMSAKENEETDTFSVKLQARFSFLAFDRRDFDTEFADNITLSIGEDRTVVGDGYRNVRWEVVSFDAKKQVGEVKAEIKVLVAPLLKQEFLASKIATLTIPELRQVLAEYPEVELDRVRFFPPIFLRSIPADESDIEIIIEYGENL